MKDSKMPKKRLKKHRDWPKGWRWKNGAIRYRVPKGDEQLFDGKTEFKLGETEAEAYRTWTQRVEYLENVSAISDLIDRYMCEVAPFKAARTYEGNLQQSERLKKAFGHMKIHSIKPTHIYQYFRARGSKPVAKREIALLSHVYTKAVEWGDIDRHPFKGQVRLPSEVARDRYITDEELTKLLSIESYDIIKLYIRFAFLTGLRKGDILTLKRSDLREDGIHVSTSKTGKRIIIQWSKALREVVKDIIELREIDITPWLFCKQDGGCYYIKGKSSGFDTMWKRFREKAGLPDIRLHDLRAKTASDFDDEKDAQKLLAHENLSMTKSYIRKPTVVRPLK